jgi:hypothetical protein
MEQYAEEEYYQHSLIHSQLVLEQILKVKVSKQCFMNNFVPFSTILIEVSCIPEVLVELPVCKP